MLDFWMIAVFYAGGVSLLCAGCAWWHAATEGNGLMWPGIAATCGGFGVVLAVTGLLLP